MINQTILVGRMTKDADLRYTPNGKAVANFTIAVDRGFGEKKETDFINCVVWDKTAEATANYTSKGSIVGVVGRIQVRNYENDEGKRIYVTEVVANEVKFIGGKSEGEQQPTRQNPPKGNYTRVDDDPFANGGQTIDISDDDLPF